jgi:hypothetical protein
MDENLRDRIEAAREAVSAAAIDDPAVSESDWHEPPWWFVQGYLAGMKDAESAAEISRRSST